MAGCMLFKTLLCSSAQMQLAQGSLLSSTCLTLYATSDLPQLVLAANCSQPASC